jgi:hypothetical protein
MLWAGYNHLIRQNKQSHWTRYAQTLTRTTCMKYYRNDARDCAGGTALFPMFAYFCQSTSSSLSNLITRANNSSGVKGFAMNSVSSQLAHTIPLMLSSLYNESATQWYMRIIA